jgi:hypothetical protein
MRNPSPEYRTWIMMKQRCLNPNAHAYENYGGRGIGICPQWLTFTGFLADMGSRPLGTTLERIDNDGDYEPGNCRWATRREQARNTRRNHLVTAFGRTQTLADWSDESGVSQAAIWRRLFVHGWSADDAVSLPVGVRTRWSKPSTDNLIVYAAETA